MPRPPFSVVVAAEAAQRIVKIAAGDVVGAAIAGADELVGVAPQIGEVLNVGHVLDRKRGHEGFDRVRPFARGLHHDVEQIVDAVSVVARAADHRVGAKCSRQIQIVDIAVGPGVEVIITRAADQEVVAEAADEIVVAGAAEDQVVAAAAGDLVSGAILADDEVVGG